MEQHRYIKFKGIAIEQGTPFLLQGINDEASGSTNKTTVNFYGTDGAKYRDILYLPRDFSVDGVIIANSGEEMARAQRVLMSKCDLKTPFELEYFNRDRRLFAEVYMSSLPSFSTRVGWTMGFTLHFVIPSFYWTGYQLNTKLFSLRNNVVSSFTLPSVFTVMDDSGVLKNKGDVETFPRITIEFTDSSTGFTLTNGTKKMQLTTTFASTDKLVIDMAERTITKNGTSVIQDVSLDSEFWGLNVGDNSITPSTEQCDVTFVWRENFL